MIPVRHKWLIQIEVTNACTNACTNCFRLIGHHKKPYFMDLGQIEAAIDSLAGFPGRVGITGGEPTLHPDFAEICHLMRRTVPREKRCLWTSGFKWQKYKSVIRRTFDRIFYNDHRDTTQKHHPMLLGVGDVVADPADVKTLIDHCWVDRRWSASINPKGCYFCEIAAAMDMLFDGPGGHPIEPGWWRQDPERFDEQIRQYCHRCGAPVPFPDVHVSQETEQASVTNYNELRNLNTPKFLQGRVTLVNETFSRAQLQQWALDWQPWDHLGVEGRTKDHSDLYGPITKLKRKLGTLSRRLAARPSAPRTDTGLPEEGQARPWRDAAAAPTENEPIPTAPLPVNSANAETHV